MPISFEYGDVTNDNTSVGDLVFYITSKERGNFTGNYIHYELVTVVKFTDERVRIRYSWGDESYVKNWHLFSRKVIQKKTNSVKNMKRNKIVEIISDSVKMSRTQDGNYQVTAFVMESKSYEILDQFSGQGKLKKAKELKATILSSNSK